jgi:hypothetical protein
VFDQTLGWLVVDFDCASPLNTFQTYRGTPGYYASEGFSSIRRDLEGIKALYFKIFSASDIYHDV